ncbi:hypothetical protein [Piscirickettsia salmonis]|uniref:hypothetical protein n=1 Tax=Piscirickettsia salmonis TaxID=1238 RepID=UPI0002D65D0C|nr:hypothetical protein [Piscirickettsia salmonis]
MLSTPWLAAKVFGHYIGTGLQVLLLHTFQSFYSLAGYTIDYLIKASGYPL